MKHEVKVFQLILYLRLDPDERSSCYGTPIRRCPAPWQRLSRKDRRTCPNLRSLVSPLLLRTGCCWRNLNRTGYRSWPSSEHKKKCSK